MEEIEFFLFFISQKSDSVCVHINRLAFQMAIMRCACTACTCAFNVAVSIVSHVHSWPHSRLLYMYASHQMYMIVFMFSYVLSLCPFSFHSHWSAPFLLHNIIFFFVGSFYLCFIRICLSIVWFLFTIFTVPSFIRSIHTREVPLRNSFTVTKKKINHLKDV